MYRINQQTNSLEKTEMSFKETDAVFIKVEEELNGYLNELGL
jgi:hypothetical protein